MTEVVFPLRVWIEDTDYGGVVYHANYLKYFERARSAWVESLGMGIAEQQAASILFAVRKVTVDYLKPARLNDRLEVVSRVMRLGRASVDFSQYLRKSGETQTALCVAQTSVVCVTPDIRPCALPKVWRARWQTEPAFSF